MHGLSDADLRMLRNELVREDLQINTVIVLAKVDLEAGDVEGALSRLRVDADKLRAFQTPLNAPLAKSRT